LVRDYNPTHSAIMGLALELNQLLQAAEPSLDVSKTPSWAEAFDDLPPLPGSLAAAVALAAINLNRRHTSGSNAAVHSCESHAAQRRATAQPPTRHCSTGRDANLLGLLTQPRKTTASACRDRTSDLAEPFLTRRCTSVHADLSSCLLDGPPRQAPAMRRTASAPHMPPSPSREAAARTSARREAATKPMPAPPPAARPRASLPAARPVAAELDAAARSGLTKYRKAERMVENSLLR